MSDADSRRVFDVNSWGLVHGTKIAAEHLGEKRGAIINLGSVVSDVGLPSARHVCRLKTRHKGFTDAYRMELQQKGAPISVTLIKPASATTATSPRKAGSCGLAPAGATVDGASDPWVQDFGIAPPIARSCAPTNAPAAVDCLNTM